MNPNVVDPKPGIFGMVVLPLCEKKAGRAGGVPSVSVNLRQVMLDTCSGPGPSTNSYHEVRVTLKKAPQLGISMAQKGPSGREGSLSRSHS